MAKFVFLLSLWSAKFLSLLIRIFKLGQASNFPGKIALSLQKDFLKHFILKESCKVIVITGTNGKSTTTRFLSNALTTASKKTIFNKSGANLLSGIATLFSTCANVLGKISHEYIILETDEATLPLLTDQIKINFVGITNLFRDQLDRYGELDTTIKLIEKGINKDKNIVLILNADDPRIAYLNSPNKKYFYGLNIIDSLDNSNDSNNKWLTDPEEITSCPKCNNILKFEKKFLAHLGNYKCSACKLARPELDFEITNYKTDEQTLYFDLLTKKIKSGFFIHMIGVFNLYNALCAIACIKTISPDATNVHIQRSFQSYSTIFGRGEKITLGNKTSWIYLIKNPTGATEVLKTLTGIPNARFMIAINDNFADGRDVSWLWDVRFDILSSHKKEIFVSGKRAYDMALRLKYADISQERIKINDDLISSLKDAVKSTDEQETLFILPTYTALLELQKRGVAKSEFLT